MRHQPPNNYSRSMDDYSLCRAISRRAIEYRQETGINILEAIDEIVSLCHDSGTDWLQDNKTAFPWHFELKPNTTENAFRGLN